MKVVVDDLEDLPTTPTAELDAPIPAMKEFAQTAAANGYQPVLIPGRDLMLVSGAKCSRQPGLPFPRPTCAAVSGRGGLRADLRDPGRVRRVQSHRPEAACAAGCGRARKANPNVTIFATLSVSPNGAYASSSVVVQAAEAIRPYVQGYAMNNVRPSDPRMIDFLTELSQG